MDSIALLKRQHEEVSRLFERYERLSHRAFKGKLSLFEKIADRIAAHNAIEEQIFYPACRTDQTEERLLESLEEHLATKRVIADLLEIDIGDETFDAKMAVLHDLFQHHREEEEEDLLPKAAKFLDPQLLEAMGDRMRHMYEDLLGEEPRTQVPSQTDSAPSLH